MQRDFFCTQPRQLYPALLASHTCAFSMHCSIKNRMYKSATQEQFNSSNKVWLIITDNIFYLVDSIKFYE